MPAAKKPSGHQFRKARRERDRKEAQEALKAGEYPKAPPSQGTRGAHLRMVEALDNELTLLYEEPVATPERQRRLCDLASALSKLQIKAELELRVQELEALVKDMDCK